MAGLTPHYGVQTENTQGVQGGGNLLRPGSAQAPPPSSVPAMPGMPPTPDLPLMGGGPPAFRAPTPSTAPVSAASNFQMPEYQAYDPNTYHNPDLDTLSGYGEQLLDPGSDYYQQLLSRMRGDIGMQGAAAKRLAALEGAESGFGGGGGAEFMQRAGDVDYATQVGMGKGAGELALAAPGMGASMMESTFAPQMQEYGLTEQSRQYGAGLGEGARQFGANVGLTQQGMANEMARFNQAQGQQAQQWEDMFNLQQDELAMQYGGDPGGYPGGGYPIRGGGALG